MLEETHLYREIHEQPAVLAELLAQEQGTAASLATTMRQRDIRQVWIAARGTSDNAGRYAQYLLGAYNDLPVGLTTPSLFSVYERPPHFPPNSLVLGISQSGQSPDIVAVLAEARRQGALTAAITNRPASPLGQTAEYTLALHAGEERAVAATKTYTAELLAIALLSAHLAQDEARLGWLGRVPELVGQALVANSADQIAALASRYRYMTRCVVIGRGFNYASAFELALKLKELTYTMVEPYSSADFLHGPFALIEHGFPAIVFAPSGALTADVGQFIGRLQAHHAEVVVVSDAPSPTGRGLRLPTAVPEWLSPLVAIIPGQLLAMHLAHERGYDVDAPRGIAKVTETV